MTDLTDLTDSTKSVYTRARECLFARPVMPVMPVMGTAHGDPRDQRNAPSYPTPEPRRGRVKRYPVRQGRTLSVIPSSFHATTRSRHDGREAAR